MSQVHGRTRLAGAASLLLTATLMWSASVVAQSPSPAAPATSDTPVSATPTVSATAAPTVSPDAATSPAPGATTAPGGSPTASWAPPAPRGPVALLVADGPTSGATIAAFTSTLEDMCPGATLTTDTASDAVTQTQQLTEALATGPVSVVIDAADPATAATLVSQAQAAGATVVVLGDDIPGSLPTWRVAYDPVTTGGRIADVVIETALDAAELDEEDEEPAPTAEPTERVVLIGGPEGDPVGAAWLAAVRDGLVDTDVQIVHDAAVSGLNAPEGKRVIEEAIAALGADGFGAVIAPDDAVAAGVIAGLVEAGISPVGRTVTGTGGTLPGTRAVVSGTQTLTTWSPPAAPAQVAAVLACAAVTGAEAPAGLTLTPIDTGAGEVPTVVLSPILVTIKGDVDGTRSVADTIVEDLAFGEDTATQVCADLAEACDAAGIVVPVASPSPAASPGGSPAASASAAPTDAPAASATPVASSAVSTAPPAASPSPAAP
ncbi:MAG: substrate-binding domain-containing protein [Chloroflexi bacterium]|nr:substrate-binding domain-containing protein [Chloroflexota bacterium]